MFWQPPKNDNWTRKHQILIHPLVSFFTGTPAKPGSTFGKRHFHPRVCVCWPKKNFFALDLIIVLEVGPLLPVRSRLHIWVQYMIIFSSFDRMSVLRFIWTVTESVAFCPKNSFFVCYNEIAEFQASKAPSGSLNFPAIVFLSWLKFFTFDFLLNLPLILNWAKNAGLAFLLTKEIYGVARPILIPLLDLSTWWLYVDDHRSPVL